MKTYLIIVFSLLAVTAITLFVLHIKTHRPIKSILIHAALGLAAMVIINLTAKFTGVKVPVNLYSVISAGTLGIPAVCLLLVLNILI